MRSLRWIAVLVLLVGSFTALAADFGNADDVKQVREAASKYGHPLHASVSHDWALCTTFTEHSDLSIVLHRSASNKWTVVATDGGAYVAETLVPFGVPKADIPELLKTYQ
jgi:hypothetical protein